jgi:DNA-binding transcriptional ArsR family regulator
MRLAGLAYFVYCQSMDDGEAMDAAVSRVAGAIAERARTRMLYCLMDGHARTCTELAMVAEVSPSTATVHLSKLKGERLVQVLVQGRHHYYSLAGAQVARALEGLSVLAVGVRGGFVPNTPSRLREARTCYDHMAGALAVAMQDRFKALGWMTARGEEYDLSAAGAKAFEAVGVDVEMARAQRRRFAYACLDWSERRPHVGGALGESLLSLALRERWVTRELDSRALVVTRRGKRELGNWLGLEL